MITERKRESQQDMNKLETRWSFGRCSCNFMTEYSSVGVVKPEH